MESMEQTAYTLYSPEPLKLIGLPTSYLIRLSPGRARAKFHICSDARLWSSSCSSETNRSASLSSLFVCVFAQFRTIVAIVCTYVCVRTTVAVRAKRIKRGKFLIFLLHLTQSSHVLGGHLHFAPPIQAADRCHNYKAQ